MFSKLPDCDVLLAYFVFKHMDVKTLSQIEIPCNTIIQCEILGSEWSGRGPVSHGKELETYQQIFEDFELIEHERFPYKRYSDNKTLVNCNTDISFLLWSR